MLTHTVLINQIQRLLLWMFAVFMLCLSLVLANESTVTYESVVVVTVSSWSLLLLLCSVVLVVGITEGANSPETLLVLGLHNFTALCEQRSSDKLSEALSGVTWGRQQQQKSEQKLRKVLDECF